MAQKKGYTKDTGASKVTTPEGSKAKGTTSVKDVKKGIDRLKLRSSIRSDLESEERSRSTSTPTDVKGEVDIPADEPDEPKYPDQPDQPDEPKQPEQPEQPDEPKYQNSRTSPFIRRMSLIDTKISGE